MSKLGRRQANWIRIALLSLSGSAWSQAPVVPVLQASDPIWQTRLDSLRKAYLQRSQPEKTLLDTATFWLEQQGFVDAQWTCVTPPGAATQCSLQLGTAVSELVIEIPAALSTRFPRIFGKKPQLNIPYTAWESKAQQWATQLEAEGYPFSSLQVPHWTRQGQRLVGQLEVQWAKQRHLDAIKQQGGMRIPVSHTHQWLRRYRRKPFNPAVVDQIQKEMAGLPYVKSLKYPEVLYTPDSTQVFVYLDRARCNTFEGFAGFSNADNQKMRLMGQLDVSLYNLIKGGENTTLNWKDNGQQQRQFALGIQWPYIGKTPLAWRAQLNIIQQDSSFQRSSLRLELGYMFHYRSRLYLGYTEVESGTTLKIKNPNLADLSRSLISLGYEWQIPSPTPFFRDPLGLNVRLGWGTRQRYPDTVSQQEIQWQGAWLAALGGRHFIWMQGVGYWLQSPDYYSNELYRFGGIQSLRGFPEGVLQASQLGMINTEYRLLLGSNLYIHTVADGAWTQDRSNTPAETHFLVGYGAGLGLTTRNGFFQWLYAQSLTDGQSTPGVSGWVQLRYSTTF